MALLEIAVQDPHGIATAAATGADRIELCAALELGGLTPSLGLIELAVASGVPVQVLIRPRAGDFVHTSAEVDLICREVDVAGAHGAAGIVIGATRDAVVDEAVLSRLVERAAGLEVTFHRAFDTLADQAAGLETLIAAGVDRVLTSGGADRAPQALSQLGRLVTRADGRIQVMAGAGITSTTVAAVLATGVDAVHASARRRVDAGVGVELGSAAGAGAGRDVTDPAEVAALRSLVDGGQR